jgi:hypothetical protein
VEKNSVTVVVDESRVEDYSTRGFRLIEIVHTDNIEDVEERTTKDDGNGYGTTLTTHCMTKSVVVRKPRFVMILDGDGALAEKQEEVQYLEKVVKELQAERDDFKLKVVDFDGKVKGLESDRRRFVNTIEDRGRELDTERASKRKLEDDIGKLRTALGDLRMKEIIGG